jgi:hypothetical protein
MNTKTITILSHKRKKKEAFLIRSVTNSVLLLALSIPSLTQGLRKLTSAASPFINSWQFAQPQINETISYRDSFASTSLVNGNDSGRLIFFGGEGFDFYHAVDDTWSYSFVNKIWIQVFPSSSPSARSIAAFIAVKNNTQMFLFGGMSGMSIELVINLFLPAGGNGYKFLCV